MKSSALGVFFIIIALGIVAIILSMMSQFNLLEGAFGTIASNYSEILGLIIVCSLCIYYLITKR